MSDSEVSKGDANFDRSSVRKVNVYVDDKGRRVEEFVPVFGKDREPSFFKGRAFMTLRPVRAGMPMPPQQQAFEFDIPANGLRAAFEGFDEAARSEIEKIKAAAQERSRIVGARSMPGVVGPDGKPVKL